MYITKALAQRLESSFKHRHLKLSKVFPQVSTLKVQEGLACYFGSDSFFSQVVGWGFEAEPSLLAIEQFYRDMGHSRVDISLPSLVGNGLIEHLVLRGYGLQEVDSVLVLGIKDSPLPDLPPLPQGEGWGEGIKNVVVRAIGVGECAAWARVVALGFDCLDAEQQFYWYSQSEDVRLFGAYYKDTLVAGGALALSEGVADLGLTSTLPAYRNQGLQKLLLLARLQTAREMGQELVMVVTEPGSISEVNAQKVGFRNAYVRLRLTRRLCERSEVIQGSI